VSSKAQPLETVLCLKTYMTKRSDRRFGLRGETGKIFSKWNLENKEGAISRETVKRLVYTDCALVTGSHIWVGSRVCTAGGNFGLRREPLVS